MNLDAERLVPEISTAMLKSNPNRYIVPGPDCVLLDIKLTVV